MIHTALDLLQFSFAIAVFSFAICELVTAAALFKQEVL